MGTDKDRLSYEIVELPDFQGLEILSSPCLSRLAHDTVFFIGGRVTLEKLPSDNCLAMNVDTWERTVFPSLNVARFSHASCTLGNYAYVFGGATTE